MSKKQQEMRDKLCELDGETVAHLFTDYHGNPLLSDGFRKHLQEEDPEEDCCQNCPDCDRLRECDDYGLYD